jgi:hypothetical protein
LKGGKKMGDNKDAMQTVLQLFSNEQQIASDHTDRRWRWRNGTILFPEGRCCYCGTAVRSEDRLWVVDGDWLRGQLNVKGETAIFEKPEHPHSGTDGGLCLGDSDDPQSALFFGINPGDPLRRDLNIPKWYSEMFGHKCGEGKQLESELFAAGPRYDEDERDDDDCEDCCHCCDRNCCSGNGTICDCGCEECYCIPAICRGCDGPIGDDYAWLTNNQGYRCHTCWSATRARCERCNSLKPNAEIEEVAEEAVMRKYCHYCAEYLRGRPARMTSTAAVEPIVWAWSASDTAIAAVNSAPVATVVEILPTEDIEF